MRLDALLGDIPVTRIRERKGTATQALLGTTIGLTDEQWQAPSLLPGWTRAHVATHLARNAEWLADVAEAVLAGGPARPLPEAEPDAVERGSERAGVELQEDLDSTAGRLNDVLDRFEAEDWIRDAPLDGGNSAPASFIPLQRLNELELHRIDLNLGYGWADLSSDVAEWLLRWQFARRQALDALPDIRVTADDGMALGSGRQELRGTRQDLLAWISGRTPAGQVAGADSVERPVTP